MSLPNVFISYKRNHPESEALVSKIEKELAGEFEFLRDINMQAGKRWTYELYDWLLSCDAAIIVISKAANAADWCRREWSVLTARWEVTDLPLIPVCIEVEFFETGILDEIQGTRGFVHSDQTIDKIKDAFADLATRSLTARDYLAAHRAWLRWQYHDAPVFQKEPYALGDVYVEPECSVLLWQEIKEKKLDPFQDNEAGGGRHSMLSTVLDLMGDPDFKDLIVIQAGPGAGKSAFTLRLANELIAKQLQPIIVRFRDLRLSRFSNAGELLDDAIRIGFSDEESPHPEDEIIRDLLEDRMPFGEASICNTVIILDGWDEVSLTGNESFKAQLTTWLPKLREYFTDKRGTKVRVILTGRPSRGVSHSGVLRKATHVLTMRPIRPKQLQAFATNISQRLADAANDSSAGEQQAAAWTLDTDQLEPVFTHYQDWFDSDNDQKSDSTGDFLGNPLLAYLTFRVFAETGQNPNALIDEPTALYHELINITAKYAGKGEDAGLEDAAHRGGERLRRLLQEVAATISILRGESVSYRELEARFEDSELPIPKRLLENWHHNADGETALQELVINFYFKGGNTDLGCEFLHKSFREYLFAEAIYNALLDAAADQQGPFKCKVYQYWEDFERDSSEYLLSRRLSYLLAPQWLSSEVRTHLFWLIDRGVTADSDQWHWIRDAVLEVYAWWAEGATIRHQPTRSRIGARWESPYVDALFQKIIPFDDNATFYPVRTSILDSHLGDALMQLTAWIFYRLADDARSEIAYDRRSDLYCSMWNNRIYFKPGGEGFFRALVNKFDTEGWRDASGISHMLLPAINLKGENFQLGPAIKTFLFRANLSRANLSRADLTGANLSSSNLTEANLRGANLSEADLRVANLSRADLTGAYVRVANLSSSNLTEANLRGANLSEADLTKADLTKADLSETDLTGSNLSSSNLTEANLRGANLSEADLTKADLTKADLSETDLRGADLTGANLTEANIEDAILTHVRNIDMANNLDKAVNLNKAIDYKPR